MTVRSVASRRFKSRFDELGAKVFGSGWVWLVGDCDSKSPTLEIVTTSGHGNPIEQGKFPLLVNDVWEHAYYLKHQNRRPEYLKAWWSIVNWKEVQQRFEHLHESPTLTAEELRGVEAGGSRPRTSCLGVEITSPLLI